MRCSPARVTPLFAVLLLAASVIIGGCDEDITAVTGTDLPFSLYGVLIPEADTQWVRVYAITGTLEPERPQPLDAVVRTMDLGTGEGRVWSDTLIRDFSGRMGHYYWTPLRARHGHTYRLTVERSDGASAEAEVTVPEDAVLVIPTAGTGRPVIQPVMVTPRVPRLMKIEVTYRVLFGITTDTTAFQAAYTKRIVYDGRQQPVSEGWRIPIELSNDFNAIRDELIALRMWEPFFGIILRSLTIDLQVVNEEWAPPGGVFNADVLAQPGLMSNVRNGFGFLGAGYRMREVWLPRDEVLTAAGFSLPR
jgi:hypothetical protein